MKNKNLLSIEHYAESFGTNKHKPKDYIKYLKRCVSLKETYISNNDECKTMFTIGINFTNSA